MKKTFFMPEIEEKMRERPRSYLDEVRGCAEFVSEHAIVVDTASPCWAALHEKYRKWGRSGCGGGRKTRCGPKPRPESVKACGGCPGVTGKVVEL